MGKRIKSPLYTEGKYGKRYRETVDEDNMYLYSKGMYPTKITKEDLPEYYINIIDRMHWYLRGYIKTAGIIDMKYEPSKVNHLFKDDRLYISYKEPLRKEEIVKGFWDYVNDDVRLSGSDIVLVISAAEKYSGYDILEIRKQLADKLTWFKENYYEDYVRQFGEGEVDIIKYYSET